MQAVTTTLTGAFADDPVWGWAFPGAAQQQVWWRFWVSVAVPQGWVRTTEDAEAVAVWIPPGGNECPPEDEVHLEPLLEVLVGDRSGLVLETLERFERNHPREVPHFYLSLLGTAPEQRGHGFGMALLAESLALIDAQHAPAYLESSNPVNLARYESMGFRPRGEFQLPEAAGVVTTMWREPQ